MCVRSGGGGIVEWRSHQEMRLEAQKAESSVTATVTDPTLCRCTVRRVINATTLNIFRVFMAYFKDNVDSSESTAADDRTLSRE